MGHRGTVAVALYLALSACGGGGGADDEAVEGASTTQTTVEQGDAAADSTASMAPGAKTTVASGTQTTTAPAPTPAPAGESPSAVGARSGHYRYKVSGTSSGGTPPTTQPHQGTSTLIVDSANGRDQRAVQTSEEGQGSDIVLRHEADATYIVSLALRGQFAKEFRPDQPVLAMKKSPKTADRWSWELRSTDGTTTMRDDTEILGREQVTVGGRTVNAVKSRHKIRIVTSFNGAPFTIDVVRTDWQAVELALTVKDHTVTDVPGFVHDESTSTLESLDPS